MSRISNPSKECNYAVLFLYRNNQSELSQPDSAHFQEPLLDPAVKSSN